MRIETGKLIDRSVIIRLLKVVPKKYLKKIKKIKVTTVPDKSVKQQTRFWGGIWANCDKKEGIIFLYLYSIVAQANKDLVHGTNTNWYHSAIEKIARSLYWEISCFNGNNKESANIFEKRMLKKAQDLNLLIVPKFRKIRFLKIMRDKYIDWNMNLLRKDKTFSHGLLPIIEHLRKMKCGLEYKYKTSELYCNIFPKATARFYEVISGPIYAYHLNYQAKHNLIYHETKRVENNNLSCFKRRVLKITKGKCYISKKGRKYTYFTDKDLQKIKKELDWKPKLPEIYLQNGE